MSSFFEKLKKGMGVETPIEEPVEKKVIKRGKKPKPQKTEPTLIAEENSPEKPVKPVKKLEIKTAPIEKEKEVEEKPEEKTEETEEKKWFEPEGQLAIDVFQTGNELIIQSAIAGIKPDNLDILMEKDIITIKGVREKPLGENGDYFAQECYWGPFSREVILPAEVDPNRAKAEMREGILTIRIPKILREKKRRIVITS